MKKKNPLYALSLCAFLLGLVLGLIVPAIFPPIAFLGTVYIDLLKLIVIPLLMAEVACGVYAAAENVVGRLGRTIALFVGMFVVSFLLTALLVGILRPGERAAAVLPLFDVGGSETLAAMTLSGFFESLFPANIFAAMSAGSILPCLLFAFVCGLAAAKVGAERAMAVMEDARRIFSRVLSYIMLLTPLGVFSLMGNAVVNYGAGLLGVCARYILTAWLGCALVTAVVMILPLRLFAHVRVLDYLRRVSKVWLVTLSTCSSAATLPTTLRVCNEEFGVPESITSLVVPLGCTIHMCGGAVSFCLLAMFSLQVSGVALTPALFVQMLLVATLMNMAAPGIPGGGIVLGATYLSILGVPGGFIGLYSGVYRLLDMAYTTVNVTGDITANVLLAEYERRRKP